MTRAVGIDVSARRGIDAALIDGQRLAGLVRLSGAQDTIRWVRSLQPPPAVVGIDAPQAPRAPLMSNLDYRSTVRPPPPAGRYVRFRLCDYHLARRGIGLYLSPAADETPSSWIAVGFALFSGLQELGLRLPNSADDHSATLLEVYPFATFVSLLGSVPPAKGTAAGLAIRARLLAAQGIEGLPSGASHDALDAVAAALTAQIFHRGMGCAPGDPKEGLIALPVPEDRLLQRYSRSSAYMEHSG